MTGGAAAKRKGTRAEHLIRAHLQGLGWYVVRAWSSIGPWDLLALRPGELPLMVQVKSGATGAYMRPAERAELLKVSWRAGAIPVLVYYPFDHKGMTNVVWRRLIDMAEHEPFQP